MSKIISAKQIPHKEQKKLAKWKWNLIIPRKSNIEIYKELHQKNSLLNYEKYLCIDQFVGSLCCLTIAWGPCALVGGRCLWHWVYLNATWHPGFVVAKEKELNFSYKHYDFTAKSWLFPERKSLPLSERLSNRATKVLCCFRFPITIICFGPSVKALQWKTGECLIGSVFGF